MARLLHSPSRGRGEAGYRAGLSSRRPRVQVPSLPLFFSGDALGAPLGSPKLDFRRRGGASWRYQPRFSAGCSAVGSAFGSGPKGRRFKPAQPDSRSCELSNGLDLFPVSSESACIQDTVEVDSVPGSVEAHGRVLGTCPSPCRFTPKCGLAGLCLGRELVRFRHHALRISP